MGESALLVCFTQVIDREINRRVLALYEALKALGHPGIRDLVPAYCTLLVSFDHRAMSDEELREIVLKSCTGTASHETRTAQAHVIPVHYGGGDGPDLEYVGSLHGAGSADVIQLHTKQSYHVYFLGFLPGFAYMGTVPDLIAAPRLQTPRSSVPRGSIGIAGKQTGIYPSTSPGGWRIIGRTSLELWDETRNFPALIAPGDSVRFVQTDTHEDRAPHRRVPPIPAIPLLQVIEAGGLASVQDLGRPGYGAVGLSAGGAMDGLTVTRLNGLLDNDPSDAVLELTLGGPTMVALRTTTIAVGGAGTVCTVDGNSVPNGISWLVRAGQTLRFQQRAGGLRSYLAVAGGIDVPLVLGSRSTCLPGGFGGFAGRYLRPGDVLGASRPVEAGMLAGRTLSNQKGELDNRQGIRFMAYSGPNAVSPSSRAAFVAARCRVSDRSDRIGLRLEPTDKLLTKTNAREAISFGVVRGAIQLPPDGCPIVLGADHQTTGGYPLLGVVAEADWPIIAQLAPGQEVNFNEISVEDARSQYYRLAGSGHE